MHAPKPPTARPTHRRAFLIGLGLTACGAGTAAFLRDREPRQTTEVPGTAAPRKNRAKPETAPSNTPSATGSREKFLPHLRSDFILDDGDTLRLLDVSTAETTGNGTLSFVSFSLLFSGPWRNDPESKIRRIEHPVLGGMELFLSPVGHSADEVCYEAVISEKA